MAIPPVSAHPDVQRAVRDLNNDIRDLSRRLDSINLSRVTLQLEQLGKDIRALQQLRRIPPPGQRAFAGNGLVYLDDRLNWSAPGQDVSVRTISSSTSVNGGDTVLLVDASGGDVTLSLPAASLRKQMVYIKKIDNTVNKVIIDADGSDLIDGDTTLELLYLDEAVPIVSDGVSEWNVL